MNLDVDAMLKESAERMADVSAALSSRCVLLAGQLAAAGKLLAEAQREIEAQRSELEKLKGQSK